MNPNRRRQRQVRDLTGVASLGMAIIGNVLGRKAYKAHDKKLKASITEHTSGR